VDDPEIENQHRNQRKAVASPCTRRDLCHPGVPQTLNGKNLEVPVKRTLSGISMNKLVNIVSMKNSDSLKFFIEFVEELK